MELTEEVLSNMSQGLRSIFDLEKLSYRVSNKNAEVTISLAFWDTEAACPDIIPISGFPRKIVAETSPRGMWYFSFLLRLSLTMWFSHHSYHNGDHTQTFGRRVLEEYEHRRRQRSHAPGERVLAP